ncbi:MAG: protein kinase [bacterium]|nr:protein kinase [bacterium]
MAFPLHRLEGKYEILEKLHEGGMGAIYKVRHRLLGELRVIKVMRPHLERDPELRSRFLAEARAATQLTHPHIARIFDCTVDDDGVAYIVMELIRGASLEELIAHDGAVPLALALEIARQSLRAIGHIHKHGVAHRDISPDNLMLGRDVDGRPLVKLIDLGIAKDLEAGDKVTGTGVFLGKFRYAAPESFDHGDTDRRRSDLYAFALVLYELLTGRFPISGDSPSSLIAGHLFRPPLPFAESDPQGRVPATVRGAVLTALAKDPDQRFANAGSFAAALEQPEPLVLETPEIRGLLALTVDEAWRKTRVVRPPGSTQHRLDGQFAPEPTPAPGPLETRRLEAVPNLEPSSEAMTRRLEAVPDPEATRVLRPVTPQMRVDDVVAEARGLAQAEQFHEARELLLSALESAGDHEPARALLASVEACIEVRDVEETTMISVPPPVDDEGTGGASELDETLHQIRVLRDDGRTGTALEELNRAVREYGAQPELQTLRYELGEALLARDAEEESGSRMFEALREEGTPAAVTPESPAAVTAPRPGPRSFSDATIRSVDAAPRAAPRSEPPISHSNRNLVIAGLVLAVVFAGLVYVLTREDLPLKLGEPVEPVATMPASPGSVVIDAAPWAEIVSIEKQGSAEEEEDPPIPPARFTPLVVHLLPGEYLITLRYPPTGQEQELVVTVESEDRTGQRVTFESYDAKRYFEQIGW